MNTAIIDTLAKGSVEAFNLGIQVERERILKIIADLTVVNPTLNNLALIITGENK